MTRTSTILAIVLVGCHLSQAAWQWPQDSGSGSGRDSKALILRDQPARGPARQRYDVYEPDADDFTLPSDFRPLRPGSSPNRPFPTNGAYAPGAGYGPGFGAAGPGGPGGFGAPGGPGYRPGGLGGLGNAGVSKCKCANPINCPSPSLQFGSCDAGKRYCCTKTARGLPGGRPVLVGPGGPTGIIVNKGGHNSAGGLYGNGGYGNGPYGNGGYGNDPYGNGGYGNGPYGNGGYGGGFGARGDVLYGPGRGGFNGGGAEFIPGPEFNRKPGASLRPLNYNIYGNQYGDLYNDVHGYDQYNGNSYGSSYRNPYGSSHGNSYGSRPYGNSYGGRPYGNPYGHPNDNRYDHLDTAPNTFGEYTSNYAAFGSRPYDKYNRPLRNIHGQQTADYGLTYL